MEIDLENGQIAEAVQQAALITGLTVTEVANSLNSLAKAGKNTQELFKELQELTLGGDE